VIGNCDFGDSPGHMATNTVIFVIRAPPSTR
jgi:hypothetical protein